MQRSKLARTHGFTLHRFRYLHIQLFIGLGCNEIHLGSADLADSNIIAAAQQLEINDVLNRVAAVTVAETKQIIAQTDIYDVILAQCAQKFLSLDIKTLDIVEKVCFKQRIHIGLNRMRTGLCLAVALV